MTWRESLIALVMLALGGVFGVIVGATGRGSRPPATCPASGFISIAREGPVYVVRCAP